MSVIGGYFELELNKGKEYHQNAIALNSARNCLEYVIRSQNLSEILIPYYTCDAILEPLEKLNVKIIFYPIDNNFEIHKDFQIPKELKLLYTNYFGIKDDYIKKLYKIKPELIIDNSQAFFSMPLQNIESFYSPRKFFGVPDGGYLYTNIFLENNFKVDKSINRFSHLIRRIEEGAESGYQEFIHHEKSISNKPIMKMSKLTSSILKSINYDLVKQKRIDNFNYLHSKLYKLNSLSVNINTESIPLVYPLRIKMINLHQFLIQRKIYIPKYWPNVIKNTDSNSIESLLAEEIIPLPIDQRYNSGDMEKIAKIILKYVESIH